MKEDESEKKGRGIGILIIVLSLLFLYSTAYATLRWRKVLIHNDQTQGIERRGNGHHIIPGHDYRGEESWVATIKNTIAPSCRTLFVPLEWLEIKIRYPEAQTEE